MTAEANAWTLNGKVVFWDDIFQLYGTLPMLSTFVRFKSVRHPSDNCGLRYDMTFMNDAYSLVLLKVHFRKPVLESVGSFRSTFIWSI